MGRIHESVFAITKQIESQEVRTEIFEAFRDLHHSKESQSNIGYLGRKQYRQFLGYLYLHKHGKEIAKNYPEPIRELPADCYRLFSYGHGYIREINKACLARLDDLLPSATKVVDPYWEIDPAGELGDQVAVNPDEMRALTRAFQSGKPYRILSSRLALLPKLREMEPQDVAKGVYSFRNRIRTFGLSKAPDDLFELGLRINSNTTEAVVGSIFLALLYLHSALTCIDQIIFQSFVSDKLTCLNEDNVYQVYGIRSNVLGEVMDIGTTELIPFPAEVILVDIELRESLRRREFCVVENLELKFSQDFGNELRVGLRCLDEYFSPYGNLIGNIAV